MQRGAGECGEGKLEVELVRGYQGGTCGDRKRKTDAHISVLDQCDLGSIKQSVDVRLFTPFFLFYLGANLFLSLHAPRFCFFSNFSGPSEASPQVTSFCSHQSNFMDSV